MLSTACRQDSYRSADASEDRAEILSVTDGSCILVVADGVGGRPGGGAASRRIVEVVRAFSGQAAKADADFWVRLLVHADDILADDPEAGETTCVVAQCFPNGRIIGASVGDSEAWLIASNGMALRLTSDAPRKPYLGHGMARPSSFTARAKPGATLLLATDGLFKYVDHARIPNAALLPNAEEAAAELIALARSPYSGQLYDDIAVLLCRWMADA